MAKKYNFRSIIMGTDSGGTYIEFPYDVYEEFNKKNLIKVKAKFDGEPYRGSLANMGGGKLVLIVLKSIRDKINKNIGDEIDVVIEEDNEPRVIVIPVILQKAFKQHPIAKRKFEEMSYSHQKEYVKYIEEAVKNETRNNRVTKVISALLVK